MNRILLDLDDNLVFRGMKYVRMMSEKEIPNLGSPTPEKPPRRRYTKKFPHRAWDESEDNMLIGLHKEGASISEMAEALPNRTKAAIYTRIKILKEQGKITEEPDEDRVRGRISPGDPDAIPPRSDQGDPLL